MFSQQFEEGWRQCVELQWIVVEGKKSRIFVTHSEKIALDIANLTQRTAIENQRSLCIVFVQIADCALSQGFTAEQNRRLLERCEQQIEIQRHISENRLVDLLHHRNAFHRQQSIEELKDILDQLDEKAMHQCSIFRRSRPTELE